MKGKHFKMMVVLMVIAAFMAISLIQVKPASAGESYVFAWIPKALNNPVFALGRDGSFKKASEITAKGPDSVDVIYTGSVASDAAEQVRVIEDVIAKGVDGIGVSCNDPTALMDVINKAVSAGIPVMTWDSDSPDSKRFTYLGVDNYTGGKAAADLLIRHMGKRGKVALLTGVPVETAACYDDINKGVQVVEEVMQAHPDLDGWFFVGLWPMFAGRGAMPLWEKASLSGRLKNVAFDTLPVELEWLKDGLLVGLVGQKYWGWGYDTIQMLYDYVAHGKRYPKWVDSGMDIVTIKNVDAMINAWNTHNFTKPLPSPF